MHARNADHAKGLLRKLQNERNNYINEGWSEEEVDAYYGPKIASAEQAVAKFQGYEEDDLRPARKGQNQKTDRRGKKTYRFG